MAGGVRVGGGLARRTQLDGNTGMTEDYEERGRVIKDVPGPPALALNALYDRAFDRGLITFDESMCVVVSRRLRAGDPPPLQRQTLLDLEGRQLRLPQRFAPNPLAMAYHREHVFL